ncbi:MAG TPA: N-acetylmuramoyl-L-alanine amidase family protein, partial [Clostridium sp.]
MLKRMSKATSLLVAVAAIISIVPANAADYKKIDSQEGTVYNAVAYKDGKFYIDGGVNNQDDASYYLANGKYNNLSDVDSGSSVEAYGSKYLNVQAGDYFVDLDNGSVTDDSIKDNAKDDTASALRKNVKKDTDGRYTVADSQTIKSLTGKDITGNKFTDLWYGVTYAADKATNGSAAGAGTLNVYTDAKGNYIDADYNLGSIKVTTNNGSTEKNVTVSNTNDKYDGAGGTKTVTASVAVDGINEKVIGQDANYIYRTAKVTVTATAGTISKINGVSVTKAAFSPATNGFSFQAIQKISKAQASDNINGAKYAKSVTTYVISKDNGDAIDANHALLNNSKYTVSNGKLINYTVGASSVQTETI